VLTIGVAASADQSHRPCQALLDSGADACVIPAGLAADLDLEVVAAATFQGFTGAARTSYEVTVCNMHVEIPDGLGTGTVDVMLYDFGEGQQCIILGRNLLALWRLTLDGPTLSGEISG
jgi:hypothetical protein